MPDATLSDDNDRLLSPGELAAYLGLPVATSTSTASGAKDRAGTRSADTSATAGATSRPGLPSRPTSGADLPWGTSRSGSAQGRGLACPLPGRRQRNATTTFTRKMDAERFCQRRDLDRGRRGAVGLPDPAGVQGAGGRPRRPRRQRHGGPQRRAWRRAAPDGLTRAAVPVRPSAGRLSGAIEEHLQALVLVLGYGGLRWGEAAAPGRGRCDLLRRRIHVHESLPEIGSRLVFGPPKTHRVRSGDAALVCLRALARHLQEFVSDRADELVFTTVGRGPLRNSDFRRYYWERAVSGAGLPPHLTPHELRHTAAALSSRTEPAPRASRPISATPRSPRPSTPMATTCSRATSRGHAAARCRLAPISCGP